MTSQPTQKTTASTDSTENIANTPSSNNKSLTREERKILWDIAIGLNKVDNLKNSSIFNEIMNKEIEGTLDLSAVKDELMQAHTAHRIHELDRVVEADLVAANVVYALSKYDDLRYRPEGFSLSLQLIHELLFKEVMRGDDAYYAYNFRNYDISKREAILNGETVIYTHFEDIRKSLFDIFEKYMKEDTKAMGNDDFVKHLAHFLSDIWEVHPFIEGNTRTTVILFMLYLRHIDRTPDMKIFIDNTQYFRDILCLSTYNKDFRCLYNFTEKWLFSPDLELPPLSNRYKENNGIIEQIADFINSMIVKMRK